MNLISERRPPLSPTTEDVIPYQILDVHLLIFLILLIAVSIHKLTLKKNLPKKSFLFVVESFKR